MNLDVTPKIQLYFIIEHDWVCKCVTLRYLSVSRKLRVEVLSQVFVYVWIGNEEHTYVVYACMCILAKNTAY